MSHPLPYEVNCSILFTELPLLERPAAAKAGRLRRRRVLVAVRRGGAGRRRRRCVRRRCRGRRRAAGRAQLLRRRHAGGRPRPGVVAGPLRGVPRQHRRHRRHRRTARLPGVQRALRQPGRRASRRRSRTSSARREPRARRRAPPGSVAPCLSSRSAAPPATRCSPRPTRSPSSTGSRGERRQHRPACRPLPPRRQRRRRRQGDRRPHRPHRARADRRRSGPQRAGHRLASARAQLADLAAAGYDGWVGLEYKPIRRHRRTASAGCRESAAATPDRSTLGDTRS